MKDLEKYRSHESPVQGGDFSSDKQRLLQSGDVELNPGPGAMAPIRPIYDAANGEHEKRKPRFNRFGQHEPPTVRIKNIINQYVGDTKGIGLEEVVKELTQNADDAKASKVMFILDKRHLPTENVWDEWKPLQGPSLCVYNNAIFTDNDIEAIQKLGVGSKSSDPDKTGQFGIGFNVVYQMTDCPTLLSDGVNLCMFDPHLTYVPGANNGCPGGHVNFKEEPEFKTTWSDVIRGFLDEYVQQSGSTVFRFPLRTKEMNSKISNRHYDEDCLQEMQRDLETIEFRLLLHKCLLFTKTVDYIGVMVIHPDGNKEMVTEVKRKISAVDHREIKSSYQRLSTEIKALMEGRIGVGDITKNSITYNMVTEDEFNTTNWTVNQTFGFHGDFTEDESEFLNEFVGGSFSGKKFSPIAGLASRRDNEDLKGETFCFLQLPIENGLPVHVNGHFAIHSSRRSLWSNTAFGDWNRVLLHHVLVPAYCSFLRSITRQVDTRNVGEWYLRLFPHIEVATESYYQELVKDLYFCILHNNLPVIPLLRPSSVSNDARQKVEFFGPKDLYFVHGEDHNEDVEKSLMVLGVNICNFPEITERILAAKMKDIDFLTPRVATSCLKDAATRMGLPKPISATELRTVDNAKILLEYCLLEESNQDYHRLDGLPLCVTMTNQLKEFRRRSPVFLSLEYKTLLPYNQDLFIHEDLAPLLNVAQTYTNTPVRKLVVADIPNYIQATSPCVRDRAWLTLMWKFLRENTNRYNNRTVMVMMSDLPILPGSDGRFYKVSEGKNLVNLCNSSKDIQTIVRKMGLPTLDTTDLVDDDLTDQDISDMASPCVMDASHPEDILYMLTVYPFHSCEFSEDECETFLFFFKNDLESIRRSGVFLKTLRLLPIYETIEGDFRSIASAVSVAVLDDSIPTKGITGYMRSSDRVLLKEKKAYSDLYTALGISKKNTIDVYTDHVFPKFASIDKEMRQSHLECIRDSVLPMLLSFGTDQAKQMFTSELQKLPFIPYEGNLLLASNFYDLDMGILHLAGDLHPLPEEFCGPEWRELLRVAGLKTEIEAAELIKCAEAVSHMSEDMEEAQKFAQIVLSTAVLNEFDEDVLRQLSEIPFIPAVTIDYDDELISVCPPKQPEGFQKLSGSLQYESRQEHQLLQHDLLAWSVNPTLPQWAKIPDNLVDILGVQQVPSVADVTQHCIQLCEAVTDQLSDEALKELEKVLVHIYDFLLLKCDCNNPGCDTCKEMKALQTARCIVLNDGTIRVRPDQVVLNFPSDIDSDTLHPYLYARPMSLAKYDELFKRLGAVKSPKPNTYANVLNKLRTESGTNPLKTNQKQTASTAVYGLFASLQQDIESELTAGPLFLPSDKAVMVVSSQLIVNDNKMIAKKFKKKKYKYLCKLQSCNLPKHPREYINLLPDELRPKILSDMVQQMAVVRYRCMKGPTCPFMQEYRMRISQDAFGHVLMLMGHSPDPDRDDYEDNIERLKVMDFICFEKIDCYLCERGIPTELISTPKLVHHEVSDEGYMRLFIKHYDEYPGDADMVSAVADAIKTMLCANNAFSIDSGKIAKLLRCKIDHLDEFLVEEGLSTLDDDMMTRPRLGAFIDPEDHWMYSCDPDVRFQPKEYVAYMLPEYENEMIHARIIRECKRKEQPVDVSNMFREYIIDVGLENPLTAQSLDLYREVKRKSDNVAHQRALMRELSEAEEMYRRLKEGMEIEEQKRQVTRLLEEVFRDPMRYDERDKLRKRLFLKWHPDKAGGTLMATEVFKHLKAELDRLQKIYPVKEQAEGQGNMFNRPNPANFRFNFQRPEPPPEPSKPADKPEPKPTPRSESAKDRPTSESAEPDESPSTATEDDTSSQRTATSPMEDGADDSPFSPGTDGEEFFDTQPSPTTETKEAEASETKTEMKEGIKIDAPPTDRLDPPKEWFRQAKRDLDCAKIMKQNHGYEWACTICYEVVRKMLVASILQKTEEENHHDLQMTRYLPKLLEKLRDLPGLPERLSDDISFLRKLNANYLFSFDLSLLDESKTISDNYTESLAQDIVETVEAMIEYMEEFNDFETFAASDKPKAKLVTSKSCSS
ncbi:sacsin-like isoform X2 [Lingula anatina]|uniref:Sacsin-like isoform X2 n=1 Tax=Lingula anatina TaxID=7574 RepID=A0A1S3K0B3_LINAN|nr:sacsin-like isoform X2 [Lingula anatina]|eukprot:XP_013416073.1 sacsin-like isoform X2 [Lingula anatina]